MCIRDRLKVMGEGVLREEFERFAAEVGANCDFTGCLLYTSRGLKKTGNKKVFLSFQIKKEDVFRPPFSSDWNWKK